MRLQLHIEPEVSIWHSMNEAFRIACLLNITVFFTYGDGYFYYAMPTGECYAITRKGKRHEHKTRVRAKATRSWDYYIPLYLTIIVTLICLTLFLKEHQW